MSNRIKLVVAAAIAAGVLSPAAFAAGPKYQSNRIPGGPRPDQYVLVRVHGQEHSDRSYALTGQAEEGRKERRPVRYVPTHPKGTHSN